MTKSSLIFAFVLSLCAAFPAWADSRQSKAQDLLKVVGTEALMAQMMDQSLTTMMPLLRKGMPEAPPGFMGLAEEEMSNGFRNASAEFIALGAAEYANTFSEDELDQLLAFYRSPLGAKTVTVLPEMMNRIMQQSHVLGQRIGQDSVRRAIKRFEAGERKQ